MIKEINYKDKLIIIKVYLNVGSRIIEVENRIHHETEKRIIKAHRVEARLGNILVFMKEGLLDNEVLSKVEEAEECTKSYINIISSKDNKSELEIKLNELGFK